MLARISIGLSLMIIAAAAFQMAKMFLYPMPYEYLLPVLGLIAIYAMLTNDIK